MKHYSAIADPTIELFNYTSGRWIYNEPQRLAERQLTFNIFQLNRIAAESVGHSDSGVSSTKKLAYGFAKTFLNENENDETALFYMAVNTDQYLGSNAASVYYDKYLSTYPNGQFSAYIKSKLK